MYAGNLINRLKRKKSYLLIIGVLAITAFVAVNNRDVSEYPSSVRANRSYQSEGSSSSQAASDQCASDDAETLGDYDTHDMYNAIGSGGQVKTAGSGSPQPVTPREKLQVFVLPFTHVDPGWLRTFDSYSNDTNQILTNMHAFMTKNPAMTFMWAEFVFFQRWWSLQNATVKDDVRKLVKEGRFELASGSWVMTDEANAYFPVSVDNIIEGHQFILEEFGYKPTVMWSNDPFGYSNSVPYIFKQAGVNRAVINRIHHTIKRELQQRHAIPFRWRQYFDRDGASDVLTHVLPYAHYDILNSCGPSAGACCEFDFKRMTHWSCPGPKPVPITDGNVKTKAATLVQQLKTMSALYDPPVLLMVHGDDFRFDMIEEWHQHHDNFLPLFKEINSGSEVEIKFGTFTEYFEHMEAWYKKHDRQPQTMSGDFFPYQCALGDLWTGYFTTRPFYKRQSRYLHSLIRNADLLSMSAQAKLTTDDYAVVEKNLQKARRVLSLFQHHDAITGTSKKHVMDNYSKLLYESTEAVSEVIASALKAIGGSTAHMVDYPENYNSTVAAKLISVKDKVFVRVYNSLPYAIEDVVTLRVDSEKVQVVRVEDGQVVEAQIEPHIHLGQIAQNSFALAFRASMSPLSLNTFELQPATGSSKTVIAKTFATNEQTKAVRDSLPSLFQVASTPQEALRLVTPHLKTTHRPNGLLETIETASAGSTKVSMNYGMYENARGGAYLMRVMNTEVKDFLTETYPRLLVQGPVQQSIHHFTKETYDRITAKNVEGPLKENLDFMIRIDIGQRRNTELVMRLNTDISDSNFFADSVGLQLLRREKVGKLGDEHNHYPMPSAAVLENASRRLTVVSNVEHGVMPLPDGMQIVMDRMLNQDDGKGLGSEPDAIPNDLKPVEMRFAFVVEKTEAPATTTPPHSTSHSRLGHLAVQHVLYPPIAAMSIARPQPTTVSAMASLPCEYQLLTNRPISGRRRILTIHRNGVECRLATTECQGNYASALLAYLRSIGAATVQESNLGGNDLVGQKFDIDRYAPRPLRAHEFLTLIITF